jgi:hypothetical protein
MEAGSAGFRQAGASQTRQIAQPSARDRGINHLTRGVPLPDPAGDLDAEQPAAHETDRADRGEQHEA